MAWFGADPGGSQAFGLALLRADGSFLTGVASYADDALEWLEKPEQKDWLAESGDSLEAAGIDAPLWWSSGESGDRSADRYLRRTFKISAGTIQTANSLRGAVLVQGVLLAMRLRKGSRGLRITEAHPKALLRALRPNTPKGGPAWEEVTRRFGMIGQRPVKEQDHERDALLAAVAAREGSAGRWTRDLTLCERLPGEQDPAVVCWGLVHYWWPEAATIE